MKRHPWLLLAVVLVFATGCGEARRPPIAKLTGTVTLDDATVKHGLVIVVSADGRQRGASPIDKTGAYAVTNAPVGKVKIIIAPQPPPSYLQQTDPKLKDAAKDLAARGLKMAEEMAAKAPKKADKAKDKPDMRPAMIDPKEQAALYKTIEKMPPRYSEIKVTPIATTVEAKGSTFKIEMKTK